MAVPTYQSTTVTDFSSDATTHNANMPATVTAGDLLLALACFDAATTTITTPAGWTVIWVGTSGDDPIIGVYGKRAAGTEGGTTVDFATSNAQRGSVHVIRLTAWAGYVDAIRIALTDTGNALGNAVAIALGPTSRDYLFVGAQLKSSTATWGTAPSGYSNEAKTNVSEDLNTSGSIASATKTGTANSERISSAWSNASAKTAWTIVVAVPGVGQLPVQRAHSLVGV